MKREEWTIEKIMKYCRKKGFCSSCPFKITDNSHSYPLSYCIFQRGGPDQWEINKVDPWPDDPDDTKGS